MICKKQEGYKEGQDPSLGGIGVEKTQDKIGLEVESEEAVGVLTERDSVALSWVVAQGAMTVDQIFRAVYSSHQAKSARYAYRRIRFLVASGFLVKANAYHRKDRFYKATRQTLRLLSLQGLPEVTRTLHVPTVSEMPHAEILTEVRLAIQASGKHSEGLWWRSEGSLIEDPDFPKERFRDLMPDAIWITKSGKRIAIEFERTRKGITRVRQKVEGLDLELSRTDRAFDLVLWLSVDGAFRDLKNALGNRQTQTLRSVSEFMDEIRGDVER